MSLAGIIRRLGFKTGDYTVTRTAASTDDGNGRRVAGATSTLTITASVQPYNGGILRVLPEGIHAEDVRHVFTETEIKLRPQPDRIALGTDTFVAFAVEPYVGLGASYYIAHVARQVSS